MACTWIPNLQLTAAMVRRACRPAVVAAVLSMPGAFFNQAFGQALSQTLAQASTQASTQAFSAPDFSSIEIQQILTLGPWPVPVRADPSNRVSGQPLAIELGRRLFRDPRMSPVGYIACVTCHQPDRAFTDLKARAHGLADPAA
jgi:cytochrome c peroxidase